MVEDCSEGDLSFWSNVISVRLFHDRIVVALLQKVLVLNFLDLKLLHQIETIAYPNKLYVLGTATRDCREEEAEGDEEGKINNFTIN